MHAFRNSSWRVKPPFGAQVNYADPINAKLRLMNLFNEGGGATSKGSIRGIDPVLSGGNTWSMSPGGPGVKFDGSGSLSRIEIGGGGISADPSASYPWSIQARFVIGFLTFTQAVYGGIGNGIEIRINGSGTVELLAESVASVLTTSKTLTAASRAESFVVTYDGVTVNIYLNGVLEATTTDIARAYSFNGRVYYGYTNNGECVSAGFVMLESRTWDRVISAEEAARLYIDPYAGVMSPRRGFYSFAPQAGVSRFIPIMGQVCV
jgi:hypothetical protein